MSESGRGKDLAKKVCDEALKKYDENEYSKQVGRRTGRLMCFEARVTAVKGERSAQQSSRNAENYSTLKNNFSGASIPDACE